MSLLTDISFRVEHCHGKIEIEKLQELPDKTGHKSAVGRGEEISEFVVNEFRFLFDTVTLLQGKVNIGSQLGFDLAKNPSVGKSGCY